jgi:hypothetical protein
LADFFGVACFFLIGMREVYHSRSFSI